MTTPTSAASLRPSRFPQPRRAARIVREAYRVVTFLTLAASLAASFAACSRRPADDPRMVSELLHTLYGAVRVERLSAPITARLFAYATTGLYAGFAAAEPTLPPISGRLNGLEHLPKGDSTSHYDPTLTALAAERMILDTLFADGLATTRAALARLTDSLVSARIATGVDSAEHARSEELGRRTAVAILEWARADGFDSTRGRAYVAPVGPGMWVNDSPVSTFATQSLSGISQVVVPSNPTNAMSAGATSDRGLILDRQKRAGKTTLPAANMVGVTEPYWGTLRPFALKRWDECPAPQPPAYGATPGAPLYEQARKVYEINKQLTPDQHTIALYWADNSGESGTPAGHWLSIASQTVGEQHLSAARGAWVAAQTGVALADAFISAWGYKFRLNVIRPRTFIRATMDSTWEPAIPTPPFPEYLSGHSTVSAAAAGTLTGNLGPVAFDDSTSISIGHAVRHYASYRAAADEAGLSRVYGGIHYPSANVAGAGLGRCIASKVLARFGDEKLP